MPYSEFLFLALFVGHVLDPAAAKVDAAADLGAVRSPARRWPRLVLGVGTVFSLESTGDLRASTERGLMDCPPRREASPEDCMEKMLGAGNVC